MPRSPKAAVATDAPAADVSADTSTDPATLLHAPRAGQLTVVKRSRPAARQDIVLLDSERLRLIKEIINPDLTDDELLFFAEVCRRQGLDPFLKQIHPVKRWDSKLNKHRLVIQTGIDGLRLIAERTGRYVGRIGPLWTGQPLEWQEVWMDPESQPYAAKCGVTKLAPDGRADTWAVARFRSFAQKTNSGSLAGLWGNMGDHMLGKVAEALALRAAFPAELGGLYIPEELGDDFPTVDYQATVTHGMGAGAGAPAKSIVVDGNAASGNATAGGPPSQEEAERAELQRLFDLMPPAPKGWSQPMFDAKVTRRGKDGKSAFELTRDEATAVLDKLGIEWKLPEPEPAAAESGETAAEGDGQEPAGEAAAENPAAGDSEADEDDSDVATDAPVVDPDEVERGLREQEAARQHGHQGGQGKLL